MENCLFVLIRVMLVCSFKHVTNLDTTQTSLPNTTILSQCMTITYITPYNGHLTNVSRF